MYRVTIHWLNGVTTEHNSVYEWHAKAWFETLTKIADVSKVYKIVLRYPIGSIVENILTPAC